MPQPRVLFMHGLESGPGGRKARHLEANLADGFACPAMQCSPFDPRESRSVSRWVAPYLVATSVAVAVAWRHGPALAGASTAALALGGAVPLVRWRLRAAVDSCVELQREAIARHRPDFVVASSWGGLVALRCIERGYWTGPAVLLAPAVAVHGPAALFFPPSEISAPPAYKGDRCVVVQGEADELVSPQAVAACCAKNGLKLSSVKAGDHRLNEFLGLHSRDDPRPGVLHEMVRSIWRQVHKSEQRQDAANSPRKA